jgi:leader peptidase (prepilin peptidase)/N-methyltransferase
MMAAAVEIGLAAVLGAVCGARLAPRHAAVALLTAVAFATVVAVRGFDQDLLLELPLAAALIALAAIDLDERRLPNRVVYPLAAWGLVAAMLVKDDARPGHLAAAAAALVLLLVPALARPDSIGMGDIKLAAAMGLYLGPAVAPALLVAFLAGALAGAGIVLRRGAAARKRTLPFGPFLAFGGLVALLAGPELLAAYEGAFLTTDRAITASRVLAPCRFAS